MGSEQCCVPCSSGWFYVLLILAAIGLMLVMFLFCSVCCCRYYWCGAWRDLVNLQQQSPTRLGRSVDLALLRLESGGTTEPVRKSNRAVMPHSCSIVYKVCSSQPTKSAVHSPWAAVKCRISCLFQSNAVWQVRKCASRAWQLERVILCMDTTSVKK